MEVGDNENDNDDYDDDSSKKSNWQWVWALRRQKGITAYAHGVRNVLHHLRSAGAC